MYSTDVFENKEKKKIEELEKEIVQLIKYKENIFKKILNKIKSFLK